MSNKLNLPPKTVLVCTGSKCGSKGGNNHYKSLRAMTRSAGKKDEVQIIRTACSGNCKMAPLVGIMPKNKWYGQVNNDKIVKLFSKLIKPKSKEKKKPFKIPKA
ncbi:(2Fe-2S) ferredoxin domain-containing protein [uncultured Microscilla sp.]|uniref:(2Fe-2S) ferredoxin domain-containing protein n=1 Tax=uncultured Microscilla sp. TaxID=432653 RepID=UPI002624C829|nr:(2Fe-2S) ferredoxin domain-containing protein [uncultured Microscilla sp.]